MNSAMIPNVNFQSGVIEENVNQRVLTLENATEKEKADISDIYYALNNVEGLTGARVE